MTLAQALSLGPDLLVAIEEDLAARMAALFRHRPELQGFTLEDWPVLPDELLGLALQGRLPVGELAVFPAVSRAQSEALREEIAATLLAALAERPAAMLVLSGRTIARALH